MSNKARIGWIDEFKGFVLLLVCLYHVEQSFSYAQMGTLHLSALRMSAFFFISGMLFSTRRFPNFKSYFVHKSKVLLFPYIMLSLLFLALDPVVYNFDLFPKAPRMTVMNIHPEIAGVWDYIYWNLAKIFVAGKSSIGSGPLWFVFTLYSVSLMFYGVQWVAGLTERKPMLNQVQHDDAEKTLKQVQGDIQGDNKARVAIAATAVASLAGGWLLYRNHVRLPLGIERDLTVLFFFACGWLCREPIKRLSTDGRSINPNSTKGLKSLVSYITLRSRNGAKTNQSCVLCNDVILVAATVISFTLYAIVENPDLYFSIMNNDLGKSLVGFIASSIFGIAGLVAAFILADKLPNKAPIRIVKGILRNISRNALVILAVHWYILLVMRLLFRAEINQSGIAYLSTLIVTAGVIIAIPLFRCKLYKLLGKEKVSVRESLSIKN